MKTTWDITSKITIWKEISGDYGDYEIKKTDNYYVWYRGKPVPRAYCKFAHSSFSSAAQAVSQHQQALQHNALVENRITMLEEKVSTLLELKIPKRVSKNLMSKEQFEKVLRDKRWTGNVKDLYITYLALKSMQCMLPGGL